VSQKEQRPKKERSAGIQSQPRLPQRLARVFSHPLRAELLAMLNEQPGSPRDLERRFQAKGREESLNLIAYHVRILEKNKAIELAAMEQIRGSTKHIYRANRKMLIDVDDWLKLPDEARTGICANAVGETVERAQAALEAGTMAPNNPVIANLKLQVDKEGWKELWDRVEDSRKAIEEAAAKAINRTPDPGARFPVTVSLLAYKSPGGTSSQLSPGA
jgi:DNA-binding PadR family transcriptional regulator